MNTIISRLSAIASIGLLSVGFSAVTASAQDWPTRPVQIASSEAGGSTDIVVRLLADQLSKKWGQPIVIDNANSLVGAQAVQHSAPDGYNLLATGSTFWVGQLFKPQPYDSINDFVPVALLTSSPSLILAAPSLPANNIEELIKLVEERPGELNYGVASIGSSGYLSAELLKSMAGLDMVRIQYKGASDSLNALMGGEVQLSFASSSSGMPHVKAGALKALAVTSATESPAAPGIPTVGLEGYDVTSSIGLFAPIGTPKEILDKIAQDVAEVLAQPEIQDQLLGLGTVATPLSAEEFGAKIDAEVTRISKLIEDENLLAE
mgnify:CR=1 FL=1